MRMLYQGLPLRVPACQKPGHHLPGSPEFCTFDAFMNRVKQMVPNYETDCASDQRVEPEWD